MNNIPETRIDKKAITAWQISSALSGLFWFIIPGLLFYYKEEIEFLPTNAEWIIGALVVVYYLINVLVVPRVRWQIWRYDVTENEIDLQRGLIIVKRTIIPINRIQHVDTVQGPIYRYLNLSSVTISTAATTHVIPALNDEKAVAVRNKISQLVRLAREDV